MGTRPSDVEDHDRKAKKFERKKRKLASEVKANGGAAERYYEKRARAFAAGEMPVKKGQFCVLFYDHIMQPNVKPMLRSQIHSKHS